ncbi:hypothetical protein [Kitasatospora sp. NPDC092286]|uniref:hypothetical protein n=1 Tax=Kitasatospora sp. NPDC092286 TaxID=3364087 RepID=UPI003830AC13
MNVGGMRQAAAVVSIVLVAGLSACTSKSGGPTAAAVPSPTVSAVEGSPEWAGRWLGDRERNKGASKVVGRYAQLAIVQRGDRQGDPELCDAEWAKFAPAQKVMVDRDGFDEGCRIPA